MTINNVTYVDAPDTGGVSHVVSAVVGSESLGSIDLRIPGWYANLVNAWIAAGNLPTPYVAPPPAPVSCQLWQLQSVMTAEQWSAVEAFIASMNDPAVSAFFAHGTNQIPSNSTTLARIGEGIGLTTDQLNALMQQAAAVSIP